MKIAFLPFVFASVSYTHLEVAKVFDFIDRPFSPFRFNELLVSPNSMKSRILRMLDTEIKNGAGSMTEVIWRNSRW